MTIEATILFILVAIMVILAIHGSIIIKELNGVEQAVKNLLAFEIRHEQRNDEMFARCEEITELQLEQLRAKVHTYDTETYSVFDQFPPVDVVGATSTGICQECNGKSICKHYDVNRDRCFVADFVPDGDNTTNKE